MKKQSESEHVWDEGRLLTAVMPICGDEAEPSSPPPPPPPAPAQPAPEAQKEQGGGGGRTAVAEAPKPAKPNAPVDQLPPFKVLLHNDDVNSVEHVVISLIELFSMNQRKAVDVTIEAHESGLALVMVTHKERAELAEEQLRSKGLTATIEPA